MKYEYQSGSYYDGEILNGNFNGKGIFYFNNGDMYEGDFENDMFNGMGIYKFKTGSSYNGQFVNDEFHGIGTYKFDDGSVEKGKFHQGKRVGKFIQIENGEYFQIVYNNDKMASFNNINKDDISKEKMPE